MTVIYDELFGELEYKTNFWRGKTTITLFDLENEILLSVDGDESANFSSIQREAFLHFIQEKTKIMNEVEKQVFEYYWDNYEDYRVRLGDESEADKLAPKIECISDLKRLVTPSEFIVRRVRRNGKRRLGLLCEVTWDIDNGLGIKIENEHVEEVGYQDIVL